MAHDVWPNAPVEWTGPNAVCFFYEAGEERSGSGVALRVVRIGTHGLTVGSRSTLWGRLSQHRGTSRGTGNHRGSIFRLLVGIALARQKTAPTCRPRGVSAQTRARRQRDSAFTGPASNGPRPTSRPRSAATSATCRSFGLTSATSRARRGGKGRSRRRPRCSRSLDLHRKNQTPSDNIANRPCEWRKPNEIARMLDEQTFRYPEEEQ